MEYFVLPALIALLIKLAVLVLARKSEKTSRLFLTMVALFALHNLTEVAVIFGLYSGEISTYMLRAYYAVTVVSLAYIVIYALEIAKQGVVRNWMAALLPTSLLMVGLVITTDLVVAGSESIGYTVTAVRGEYYAAFQLFSLAMLTLAMFVLVRGFLKARDELTQVQSLYTAIAVTPVFLVGLIVLIVMQLEVQISAALLMPVATSAFLFLTFRSEREHGLTDIGAMIGSSRKRITANIVADLTQQYLDDRVSLKDAKNEFERQLLQHNLDRFGNNVSKTARELGMKRTTIYSMVKKHGISVQEKEA